MADSSTTLARLNEIKHQQDRLHLDMLRLEQQHLHAKLSFLETSLESGQLRYAAQRRHIIDLESRIDLARASFYEQIQLRSSMQKVQVAAVERNMANEKLQEKIEKAKTQLAEYELEIGEIIDKLEDEQPGLVPSQ